MLNYAGSGCKCDISYSAEHTVNCAEAESWWKSERESTHRTTWKEACSLLTS
jgi:hypothetical protein